MTTTNNNEDLEKKIIEAAKELFIENGFAETSMSDIAAKVGINRPALHYYFRTKDKMFQAVFGNIILSFIPKIHDIIIQQDKPVSESIGEIVDAYYKVFTENPCLPLFMVREMHRDMNHLSDTIKELRLEQYLHKIMDVLQEEMNDGRLKTVPLPFVFYTFYSALTVPFLTKNLSASFFLEKDDSFEDILVQWKPYIVRQMETERGLDRAAAIAHMRFDFIDKICDETVVRPHESREHLRSVRIDKVLTGRHTAIPCFVGIMGLVFFLTFGVIGKLLSALLSMGINALGGVVDSALTAWNAPYVLRSLVMDGIWGGVGSVLQFLPIIVTLFFFLSLLEDSGYMARVAFVMDKLLRKIGLSGRSIVPMLIGFGCTVPGVMASRTLTSERDRKMTILLTPFMSCSAKLPIYAFFSAAFFPKYSALVMTALYFGGILMGLLMALVLRGTMFRGEAVPFVMELPNYRLPGAKNVCRLLWDKAKDFLQRAFTVIFLATLIIWFLQTFDLRFAIVSDSSQSILAMIAGVIAPVFRPMGFGDWRISTALISGFMAKESVVSTLTVLFGSTSDILACLTPLAAASLLVFCLLYTPCVAAIASIKRELGGKWAVFVVIAQCVIAWLAAFVVHGFGTLFV